MNSRLPLLCLTRGIRPASLIALLALLGVTSCSLPQAQPDLTRFFVLTSVPPATPRTAADETAPRLYIRSVTTPEYLRGKIMVVSLGSNAVRYVDESRWAEPLDAGLLRVLREDLNQRPGVRLALRPTDERDFEATVQIRHCEGVLPAQAARLSAHVEIFSTGNEPKVVAQDDVSFEIKGWDGHDYGQLAARLSEATAELSDRLIALLPRRTP